MAPRIKYRKQYDDAEEAAAELRTKTINNDPSLTQQHFTLDADINEIMRRFGVTDGAIPPVALDPSFFGDFSNVPDFREALDTTRDALERFNALPAPIRNRFSNDPVALWAWVNDPANHDEAVKLGLLKRREPPAPPLPVPTDTNTSVT